MTINIVDLKECDNLIVFGSSLSISDYSYFFSVFDKMDIIDSNRGAKIIFAYKIYDENNEEEIKNSLTLSVNMLFQEYSKYKGINEQPNRLLDYLTIQGCIIFYLVE